MFKSSGTDGIFPWLIQEAIDILLEPIRSLYIASYRFSYIPRIWRGARVVFIPKAGNRSLDDPRSWRPVTCASVFVKGMEKPVEKFLVGTVMVEHPLRNEQFAYRPGRSPEMALSRLVRQVEKNFEDGEVMISVFFDIQGAFDNVSFDSVLNALQRRGVEAHTRNWLESLLRSRECVTELCGVKFRFGVSRGVPQGGVLSPLLWNMVADGALCTLVSNGYDAHGFADDIWAVVKGRFGDVVSDRAQSAIRVFSSWVNEADLKVNPDKIKVLVFTRKLSERRKLTTLEIDGQVINYSDTVKVLGVIIDDKLTWNAQLKYALERGRISLFTCQKMIGKTWGLTPKMMKWLYETIIKPRAMYGAGVWWKKTEQITCQNELGKFQRLACMMITGAFKNTPTLALEAALNMIPLHIEIQKEALTFTWKLWQHDDMFIQKLADPVLVTRLRQSPETDSTFSDMISTKFCFEHKFDVLFYTRDDWIQERIDLQADVIWWTDGAKNNNGVGAGAFEEKSNTKISIKLDNHVTVFQSESFALLKALESCLDSEYLGKKILIFSDSLSLLKSLDQPKQWSKLLWDCIIALNQLGANNDVTLAWCPGHSGHVGNEEADKLAVEGSKNMETDVSFGVVGMTVSVIKNNLKIWAKRKCIDYWNNKPYLRHSKNFIKPFDEWAANYLLSLSRRQLRFIIGFLTGHGAFRGHLKTMRLVQDDSCRFCDLEVETAEHILCECDRLARHRRKVFGAGFLSPSDFLSMNDDLLMKFISNDFIQSKLKNN